MMRVYVPSTSACTELRADKNYTVQTWRRGPVHIAEVLSQPQSSRAQDHDTMVLMPSPPYNPNP